MQHAEFLLDVERVDGRWQLVVQLEQMKAGLVLGLQHSPVIQVAEIAPARGQSDVGG
jgi:hypothetical protein